MKIATHAMSDEQASEQAKFTSLDVFLTHIEKKAYCMALLGVGQHADAIDILQDAMMKLVSHYAQRPSNEWKPLFYRILNNRIMDWHRQQKLRNRLFFWRTRTDEETDTAFVEQVPDDSLLEPAETLNLASQQQDVMQVLEQLPLKQQQCFLLRSWEGLSVAETAEAMGCSQGSVKTHFFRAVQKIKTVLEEQHDVTI